MTSGRRNLILVIAVLGALSAPAGYVLWDQLLRAGEPAVYEDPEEQFKYGALGLKAGLPTYLWAVMPEVFADLMPHPGGWEVFGFLDEGRGYPVGFAEQTVGFPSLTPNCALCHSGSYRTAEDADRVVVPGAPAVMIDFQGFNKFLFDAAADSRFRAAVLLPAIETRFSLGSIERMVYRYVLIPLIRRQLEKQAEEEAWMKSRPEAGRGRLDSWNLFKISILGLPDDGSDARCDFLPLFDQAAQEGHYLHWNGTGNDLHQEDLMSVYPTNRGASKFLAEGFARTRSYLHDLEPPEFPFPIDEERASAGEMVYREHCAACHAPDGDQVGEVTALAEVQTDPLYLGMWTEALVDRLESIDEGPFEFSGIRRTDGYSNVLLHGVWIQAPYLHNGSVPTLADLLEPPAQRPEVFYRGSDVYDPVAMGFVSDRPDWPLQTEYDTKVRGNSNAGHLYGTDLEPQQKQELLEYLKTL